MKILNKLLLQVLQYFDCFDILIEMPGLTPNYSLLIAKYCDYICKKSLLCAKLTEEIICIEINENQRLEHDRKKIIKF